MLMSYDLYLNKNAYLNGLKLEKHMYVWRTNAIVKLIVESHQAVWPPNRFVYITMCTTRASQSASAHECQDNM